MGIDFSKFSKDFKAKFEAAAADKKVSLKEFNTFSQQDQATLTALLNNDPDALGNIVVVNAEYKSNNGGIFETYLGQSSNGLIKISDEAKSKYKGAVDGWIENGEFTLRDASHKPIKNADGTDVKFVLKEKADTNFRLPLGSETVRKEVRKFMVSLLKEAYDKKENEFKDYIRDNKNGFSFKELGMELHDVSSAVKDNLTKIGIPMDRTSTREEISQNLYNKGIQLAELSGSIDNEENFNKLFNNYFGTDFNYESAYDYMYDCMEWNNKDVKDKLTFAQESNDKFSKTFDDLTKNNFKTVDDYIGNSEKAGELLDLAFNVALMHVGASSAFAKATQMAAKGGAEMAESVMVKTLGKEAAESTIGRTVSQATGIVSAQTTNAGLSAVGFQSTKAADLVSEAIVTGKINKEKAEQIGMSIESLFKFGYVGGAISGPLGMQVKGMTTRLLNSEPILKRVLTGTVTNKPIPLTSVLKNLSEHSEALGTVLKFGTEFGINAGYMAYDEGISYDDALKNLAQMDGVSKMVVAMLGGKNLEFLTPKKIQQIKTDLAGYKVNIAIKDGQKIYSVKDTKGQETILSTPEELMMFILDKEATTLGIKGNEAKPTETSSQKTETDNKVEAEKVEAKAKTEKVKAEVKTETKNDVNKTKKTYQRPELEVKSLELQDDLMANTELKPEDVLEHLKKIGVNQECINMFASSIKDGSMNLDACKELFETVKNDKELLESDFGIMIFSDIKAEDVPYKIEAYKIAKAEKMDVNGQTGLIMETTSKKQPKEALADIQLQNVIFKMQNSDNFKERRKALDIIPALKECAEKNSAQFVMDNLELLKRKPEFSPYLTPENIELAKILDEYQTKMHISHDFETISDILTSPKENNSFALDNMTEFNKEIVKSEKAVAENKQVSTQDFANVLMTKLSGEEDVRYDLIDKILPFVEKDGNVSTDVLKLVDAIKENYKENSVSSDVEMIINLMTTNKENKYLGEEIITEALEFIDYLKSNNCLETRSDLVKAFRSARDENGDFSTRGVMNLYKKGYKAQSVEAQYNYANRNKIGNAEQVLYAVYLELEGCELSQSAKKFAQHAIEGIKKYNDKNYKKEVLENLNTFKANAKEICDFYERLVEYGYECDNTSKVPLTVSELHKKAYKELPKPKNIYESNEFLKILSNITEENYALFEKMIKDIKQNKTQGIDFDVMANVLEQTFTKEHSDILIQAFDNKQFHTKNGFEIYQMSQFLDAYNRNPEIAKEWVDKKIDIANVSMQNFAEMVIGRDNDTPLSKEQREFVYELLQFKDRGGNLMYIPTYRRRNNIIELSPDNYDIVKEYAKNSSFINNMISAINDLANNEPAKLSKLKQAVKDNPKIAKYFDVDLYCSYPEKANLLLKHEDLLESFNYFGDLENVLTYATDKIIEDAFSVLKNVSPEIRNRYEDALAKIYTTEVANKIGLVHLSSKEMTNIYEASLKLDKDVAGRMLEIVWNDAGNIQKLNLENVDIVGDYIKSNPYQCSIDYVIKCLNSNIKLSENVENLKNILDNKDKFLKQVAVRCKDLNPKFIEIAKKYIENKKNVDNLIFLPNLSMNNLVTNFYEVGKIFNYVEAKPQDYINGHYSDRIINGLKEYRSDSPDKPLYDNLSDSERATIKLINNDITTNIENKFMPILDAIATTDIETVKLLLDKRFNIFADKIDEINNLSSNAKAMLSDVIRNGKRINKNGQPDKLTGQQKIDMILLIKGASMIEGFDLAKYKTPLKNGAFILDNERLHNDVMHEIFVNKGLSETEIANMSPEKKNWNMKYVSLLSANPVKDEGELKDVVRAASLGDFNEYITDKSNKYGQTNAKTEADFKANGLNFEQWNKPDIPNQEFEVAGKKCHIKMWDRNPQEDMFLGSKTNCCTALDRTNGGSMAIYMLNKSYQVIELYNSNGDVVGMSRVFMAKIDGKPTLMMDNIELNKEFIKNMNFNEELKDIRDNFFQYMNKYAEKITGQKDAKVLFYANDHHVPIADLKPIIKETDFIGSIHRDEVYINAAHLSYQNPAKLKDVQNIKWLEVPKN